MSEKVQFSSSNIIGNLTRRWREGARWTLHGMADMECNASTLSLQPIPISLYIYGILGDHDHAMSFDAAYVCMIDYYSTLM